MHLFLQSVFLCLVLMVGAGVRAEVGPSESAPAPSLSQVALSEDIVTRFLASYPEVKEIAQEHKARGLEASDTERRLEALGELPQLTEAQPELNDTVERHGFDDVMQWTSVGQSVVLAYSYAKSGRKPGDSKSQMAEAIEKIRNSPHISEEDKTRFVELMRESQGFVGAMEPPEANVALLERMGDAVGTVLDQ